MSSWLDEAACRGRDTRLWFPAQGDQMAVAVAKAVCRSCPVCGECLTDALEVDGPRFGVRGGLTAAERAALARSARRTSVPA